MSILPEDVEAIKKSMLDNPSHELAKDVGKLTQNTSELAAMWKALEKRRSGSDDLWVWAFLRSVEEYKELPRFHYKSPAERKKLSDEIVCLAESLAVKLKGNGLDAHLIHNDGKMFNGFFIYEDFGDSNRARFDADNVNKAKVSELIRDLAKRAQTKIEEDPIRGKGRDSNTAKAVRFARLLVNRNRFLYETPLNQVVATAANALFGTAYAASDIANLKNR